MKKREKFLLPGVARDRGVGTAFGNHHSPKGDINGARWPGHRFHGRYRPRNKHFSEPGFFVDKSGRLPIRIPICITLVLVAIDGIGDGPSGGYRKAVARQTIPIEINRHTHFVRVCSLVVALVLIGPYGFSRLIANEAEVHPFFVFQNEYLLRVLGFCEGKGDGFYVLIPDASRLPFRFVQLTVDGDGACERCWAKRDQ